MWADCRVLEMTIHIIYMQHDRFRLCGCGLRIFSLSNLPVLLPFFCPSFLLFTFKTRWHMKRATTELSVQVLLFPGEALVPALQKAPRKRQRREKEEEEGGARRGTGGFEDGEDGRIRGDEAQTGGEEAENILRTLRLRSEELQRGKRASMCALALCVYPCGKLITGVSLCV